MDIVRELLTGAVDTHIHSGPGLIKRSLDHKEACCEAMAAQMSTIILKDQHGCTANIAKMLKKYVVLDNELEVLGGLPLNNACGGINPSVVESAIHKGAAIIWMPTLSAANHKIKHAQQSVTAQSTMPRASKAITYDTPLTVLDGSNKLTSEIKDIIRLIADANVILATGHLSKLEIDLVIDEAKKCGVKKILMNHPEHLLGATLEDMAEYAKSGIYLEHSYALYYSNKLTNEYLFEMIRLVGAGKTIVSSDLGQIGRPRPVDGYRDFISAMLQLGLTEHEIKLVIGETAKEMMAL